jgi:hypothetical protein
MALLVGCGGNTSDSKDNSNTPPAKHEDPFGKLGVDVYNGIPILVDKDVQEAAYEIQISWTNGYDQPITGVKGVLYINDAFGDEIWSIAWILESISIAPGESYDETGAGMSGFYLDTSWDDDKAKARIYNSKFEELQFVFKPETILFEDGSKIGA